MSFRTQVASSAAWAGASNIVIKMFSFVAVTLVLARLLDVADFGLVAVALLAINSIDLFREFGIASALIYRQDKEDEEISADVAYISLLVGGVFVYAAIYVTAPWVELFFKDAAGVTPVLRTLGLIVLINSFSQIPYTLLAKRLQFRAKAIPEIIGGLLNSIVAILLALLGFGVWALVAGYLTDAIVRTLLVWFVSPWRPRGASIAPSGGRWPRMAAISSAAACSSSASPTSTTCWWDGCWAPPLSASTAWPTASAMCRPPMSPV